MKKFLSVLIAVLSSLPFTSIVSFAAEINSDNLEQLLFMEIPPVIGVSKKAENINEVRVRLRGPEG